MTGIFDTTSVMRLIKPLLCTLAAFCLLPSCSDDEGSVITNYVLDGTSISTSDSNIVLTAGNSGGLALTVYWQNPPVSGGLTLQFSLSSDFEALYEEDLDDDALAAQFTVQELQDIVDGLGAEGGVATKVYLRLSQTASGVTATGSYISITVTPYSTDKSTLYLTTSTGGDFTSIPATDDGEYEGFVSTPPLGTISILPRWTAPFGALPTMAVPAHLLVSLPTATCGITGSPSLRGSTG